FVLERSSVLASCWRGPLSPVALGAAGQRFSGRARTRESPARRGLRGSERSDELSEIFSECAGGLREMDVAARGLALNAVLKSGQAARIGKSLAGEAPRERSSSYSGEGERGGNDIGQMRDCGHGRVMRRGRTGHGSRAQFPVQAPHTGERSPVRMVGGDRDGAAFPKAGMRGGIASTFSAKHRMRAHKKDAGTHARSRRLKDRLFDPANVRQD